MVSLDDKYLYFSNWIRGGDSNAVICASNAAALLLLAACCTRCLILPFQICTAVTDINQYDISDPENPKHVGRVWVGGSIQKGSGVTVTEGVEPWLRHVFFC